MPNISAVIAADISAFKNPQWTTDQATHSAADQSANSPTKEQTYISGTSAEIELLAADAAAADAVDVGLVVIVAAVVAVISTLLFL